MIGELGHPAILTPTLDQLVRNGVAYTNAYSTTPTCIPARRELMTGTLSPTHGDRVFNETLPMPDLPTLAQTFRDAGYQAYAVGKLHVYPQRDRIGFDDVLLNEEGRNHLGLPKDDYEMFLHWRNNVGARQGDYEMFLSEQGYAGQEFAHGMGSNDYGTRPWHLPEYCHPTNWTVREMSRFIARRDPTRPGFWYMSFQHPHPPLVPLADYMAMYRDVEIDMPFMSDWAKNHDSLPYALRERRLNRDSYPERAVRLARQAFYALCTHVDHQIRLVIGLLREEGLLDNTVIMFTSDHGDMLGNHGFYGKDIFYEDSARIPMILVPQADRTDLGQHRLDDRLAAHCDIFPTLMELCEIPVPETVEGQSLVGDSRRDTLYGEHWEDAYATRMVRSLRHKLIYYAAGNRSQLFDMQEDPDELHDLADDPAHAGVRRRLTDILVRHLYGSDLGWLDGDTLTGLSQGDWSTHRKSDRDLGRQRGLRFR